MAKEINMKANIVHPASHLRDKAYKKLAQNRTTINKWVDFLAVSISNWCYEYAEDGEMFCHITEADLRSIMNDVPKEKEHQVILETKKVLESVYSYKIILDHFDPKKPQDDDIHGITVDWSGDHK